MEAYLSEIISLDPQGGEFGCYPATVLYYEGDWCGHDGRLDDTATPGDGLMLVECNPDQVTHDAMIADGRITHVASY